MIRQAERRDFPQILEMMADFHRAYGLDMFPADENHAVRLIEIYYHDPNYLLLVATDADDMATALLMAACGPYDFAPVRIATERLWWVTPAARGTVAVARGMLDAYEQWARDRGAEVVTMSGLTANPATGIMYARRGYVSGDTTWLKRLRS